MLDKVAEAAWESDENTPNSLGRREAAAENLRELAGQPAQPVKSAINRAAKLAGFEYTRASDIWYRKARRIEDFEQTQIADALAQKNKLDARKEFQELRVRMARLESLLAQTDPDFHRETLQQLRGQLR